MKRRVTALLQTAVICGVLFATGTASAQNWSITDDLNGGDNWDAWILGANEPENVSGERGDGTTGPYICLPVGTSPFYYEFAQEGEGEIVAWIKDPGKCLDNPNPGYPNGGPMWGLQTSGYASVCIGIGRASYVAGCQGYSPWSSVAPYSYYWLKDGVRASHSHAFTPGWYKWTIAGGWDDISFTLHDVTYEIQDGAPHDDDIFGDLKVSYDATHAGGAWEAVFGDGWNAFYARGDAEGGVENICIQIVDGSSNFEDAAPVGDDLAEAGLAIGGVVIPNPVQARAGALIIEKAIAEQGADAVQLFTMDGQPVENLRTLRTGNYLLQHAGAVSRIAVID